MLEVLAEKWLLHQVEWRVIPAFLKNGFFLTDIIGPI
jgi:hypothetical protein